uniref:Uncharacterized protein n=1 Tax=Mola mola TaxID=94237 RepID=A0A3Q3XLW8_MOLML
LKTLKIKFLMCLCFPSTVNEWNKNDERLLAAVEHGEVEKVASLLSKKDSSGRTALHHAGKCLRVPKVFLSQLLLKISPLGPGEGKYF